MKQFIKKLFGIDKIEKEIAEATMARDAAIKAEEIAKLSPKERATANKEPWVAVLDTHVNNENVRNGFFELDWNEYFVLQLRSAGYTGNSDEEVVDIWFQELCRNVGSEEGVNMDRRGSGFINVNNIGDGKSEVY
jgi:hypothetical protein